MNTIENFRAELQANGLDYAGLIIPDGKLRRFKATGDQDKNSWYVFHSGTSSAPAAGAFGCWKRGIKETWCEKKLKSLSDHQRQIICESWKIADGERKRAESERQAQAREIANRILELAHPVQSHPYLTHKQVKPLGELRGNPVTLMLPLRDADGVLHSLQYIDAEGGKKFLSGGLSPVVSIQWPKSRIARW